MNISIKNKDFSIIFIESKITEKAWFELVKKISETYV